MHLHNYITDSLHFLHNHDQVHTSCPTPPHAPCAPSHPTLLCHPFTDHLLVSCRTLPLNPSRAGFATHILSYFTLSHHSVRLVGLRIIGTTVVGIASFLLQLVYTVLLLQSQGSDSEICELCSPPCSLECSFGCSIYWWIVFSPEFSIIIHLLSTALTMLLILW